MKLFINELKTEITKEVEIEKEITIDVDISKLEGISKSDLLSGLFSNMSDEEIEDCIDNNDNMVRIINKHHLYFKNETIQKLIWILEGDVDHNELEKDLMFLIEKHGLQKEI